MKRRKSSAHLSLGIPIFLFFLGEFRTARRNFGANNEGNPDDRVKRRREKRFAFHSALAASASVVAMSVSLESACKNVTSGKRDLVPDAAGEINQASTTNFRKAKGWKMGAACKGKNSNPRNSIMCVRETGERVFRNYQNFCCLTSLDNDRGLAIPNIHPSMPWMNILRNERALFPYISQKRRQCF